LELLADIVGDLFGNNESLKGIGICRRELRIFLLQRVYQVETDIHGRRCNLEVHNNVEPLPEGGGKVTEDFQER